MPVTHLNVARLIPRSQVLQNPESRMNSRQRIASSNIPHPNTVQLSPLHSINELSNVRLVHLSQTPVSRENLRPPTASSNTPHPNTVQLIPYPQSSTISVSPRANRFHPTSVARLRNNNFQSSSPTPTVNSNVNQLRTNINYSSSNSHNPNIAVLSPYGR